MIIRLYWLQLVLDLQICAVLRLSLLEESINDLVLLSVAVQLNEVVEVHAARGVLAGLVDGRGQHHLLC